MASGAHDGAFATVRVATIMLPAMSAAWPRPRPPLLTPRAASHARTPALHANMHITTNKYPSWHQVAWKACGLHAVAALLARPLPGGLPLAARGRTRARPTPRSTFDIVPKTLPKTLPRYGMVTGAVLSSSLSSLLGDACAPRPRTRRSVVVSTAIDVNKDAPLALDTARRGAVPTAPIDARADRARDAHRLLCDLRHRLACARAVLFLSSPSAVALGRRPHRPHAIAPPPAQNQRRAPWCVSPARDQVGYEGRGAAQPGDYGNVTATSGTRVAFEWGFSPSAPFR